MKIVYSVEMNKHFWKTKTPTKLVKNKVKNHFILFYYCIYFRQAYKNKVYRYLLSLTDEEKRNENERK